MAVTRGNIWFQNRVLSSLARVISNAVGHLNLVFQVLRQNDLVGEPLHLVFAIRIHADQQPRLGTLGQKLVQLDPLLQGRCCERLLFLHVETGRLQGLEKFMIVFRRLCRYHNVRRFGTSKDLRVDFVPRAWLNCAVSRREVPGRDTFGIADGVIILVRDVRHKCLTRIHGL